jgi:hypothetical protein
MRSAREADGQLDAEPVASGLEAAAEREASPGKARGQGLRLEQVRQRVVTSSGDVPASPSFRGSFRAGVRTSVHTRRRGFPVFAGGTRIRGGLCGPVRPLG